MTRKDYLLIEGVLQDEYRWAPNPSKELGAIYRVAYMLGDALAKQDKNFDCAHFLAVVRGEKELTSKPVKMASCIADGCGMSFDSAKAIEEEQDRNPETLRPFWMRYCPKHRVTGKLYPAIVEKTR